MAGRLVMGVAGCLSKGARARARGLYTSPYVFVIARAYRPTPTDTHTPKRGAR